jgi:hypothetical protein
VVAIHERLGRHLAGAPARLGDPIDILHRERQRLLAQHVFAGLERAHRPLDVQMIRQRNVDDVDVGVGEQRLVRPERPRNVPLTGVVAGAIERPARHRGQLAARRGADRRNQRAIDTGGTEESPA